MRARQSRPQGFDSLPNLRIASSFENPRNTTRRSRRPPRGERRNAVTGRGSRYLVVVGVSVAAAAADAPAGRGHGGGSLQGAAGLGEGQAGRRRRRVVVVVVEVVGVSVLGARLLGGGLQAAGVGVAQADVALRGPAAGRVLRAAGGQPGHGRAAAVARQAASALVWKKKSEPIRDSGRHVNCHDDKSRGFPCGRPATERRMSHTSHTPKPARSSRTYPRWWCPRRRRSHWSKEPGCCPGQGQGSWRRAQGPHGALR